MDPQLISFLEASSALFRVAAGNLDLFGLLGLICGLATSLMPHRRFILLSSAVCSLCFSVHFLRLGSATGMAMNLIGVTQCLLAVRFVTERGRPAWLGAAFTLTFLLAAGLTLSAWSGWPSAFAGIGTLVSTAARLQTSPQNMRGLLIGSALCWAGHNLIVGSVWGLTCDVLTLLGFAIAFAHGGLNMRSFSFAPSPAR